jgi:hypothetical protein
MKNLNEMNLMELDSKEQKETVGGGIAVGIGAGALIFFAVVMLAEGCLAAQEAEHKRTALQ